MKEHKVVKDDIDSSYGKKNTFLSLHFESVYFTINLMTYTVIVKPD